MLVIDESGKSLGVISRDQAIFLACDKGLDLIEIDPNSQPAVAKFMDYGKFIYDQQKKETKQKVHRKISELKEIRLSFKIDDHDLETKARRGKEFLQEGDKVKAVIILRGRENIFSDKAKESLMKFIDLVNGKAETIPVKLGNRISVIIAKKS